MQHSCPLLESVAWKKRNCIDNYHARAAMRDKIAENLEVFLQRPLAPRKPGSELPPEVTHAHQAPTELRAPKCSCLGQRVHCAALRNAGTSVMSLLLDVCFCADGDAEEHGS